MFISPPSHKEKAQRLLEETRANGGLAPVDLGKFWADQEIAVKDPFGAQIPQCALGIMMSSECVFDELGVEEDHWRYQNDPAWALPLAKAYNDKAEKIVGRRLINEQAADPARKYPPVKMLHDIFEAKNIWHGNSWWLQQSARNEGELTALLDRVDERLRNLRAFILPPNWAEEKTRLMGIGVKPPVYRGQRGPVTFATSVYGAEDLIFLILDNPDLATRFSNTIKRAMLELARVLDEEADYTPENAPRGFWFADDNCCLLNPEMYKLFGYPVLKAMFDRYSPDAKDPRFQHSDSNMAHLLPLLGTLNLTGTNFGPTLTVSEIREHLPNAVIQGQLAPFTFSRNEEESIVLEFLRDFDMAREKRGLRFETAGSINNGSRLTGMRLIMAAIQRYGRFDS